MPALFCPLPVIVLAHFVLLGTSSVGEEAGKMTPAITDDRGRSTAVRALVSSTDLYCISVTLLAHRHVTQASWLSPPASALRSPGPARHQTQSHLHRGLRTAQRPRGEGVEEEPRPSASARPHRHSPGPRAEHDCHLTATHLRSGFRLGPSLPQYFRPDSSYGSAGSA
ncbi:hypothetical protein NDU88_005880 [Pleurodeles waltl]|uniref:Secreted protein n=1 Tax=Pleurodeles waltl TaxID=8319 RepID=A0AAV7UMB6_PLEWA|nr:hypothetical protein NDU88_005880 [Pleurodeles waltl]